MVLRLLSFRYILAFENRLRLRIEKEGYTSASSDWVRVPSESEPDLSVPLVPLTAFSAGATTLPQSVAFAD